MYGKLYTVNGSGTREVARGTPQTLLIALDRLISQGSQGRFRAEFLGERTAVFTPWEMREEIRRVDLTEFVG